MLSRLPGKQGLHAAEFNDSSDSYKTTPERKCNGQLFRVTLVTGERPIRFCHKSEYREVRASLESFSD